VAQVGLELEQVYPLPLELIIRLSLGPAALLQQMVLILFFLVLHQQAAAKVVIQIAILLETEALAAVAAAALRQEHCREEQEIHQRLALLKAITAVAHLKRLHFRQAAAGVLLLLAPTALVVLRVTAALVLQHLSAERASPTLAVVAAVNQERQVVAGLAAAVPEAQAHP
jgi:hypothetical protein